MTLRPFTICVLSVKNFMSKPHNTSQCIYHFWGPLLWRLHFPNIHFCICGAQVAAELLVRTTFLFFPFGSRRWALSSVGVNCADLIPSTKFLDQCWDPTPAKSVPIKVKWSDGSVPLSPLESLPSEISWSKRVFSLYITLWRAQIRLKQISILL